MNKLAKTRKYFSYTEIIENPELPFINNSKDSGAVLVPNDKILDLTLKDFIFIIKKIKQKATKEE